jgi:hypothetical protein
VLWLVEEIVMGFLDFLKGEQKLQCPNCGADGAKKSKDGTIHCPNRSCPYFDTNLAGAGTPANWTPGSQPAKAARTGFLGGLPGKKGTFVPARPITIRYRNFQNQDKEFTADADATVRKKNHLVAAVAPKGTKIALSRDRIQNLSEVENALPRKVESGQPWPSPREAQVLGYHKKHGTSSALYQKIRAKYPNW